MIYAKRPAFQFKTFVKGLYMQFDRSNLRMANVAAWGMIAGFSLVGHSCIVGEKWDRDDGREKNLRPTTDYFAFCLM